MPVRINDPKCVAIRRLPIISSASPLLAHPDSLRIALTCDALSMKPIRPFHQTPRHYNRRPQCLRQSTVAALVAAKPRLSPARQRRAVPRSRRSRASATTSRQNGVDALVKLIDDLHITFREGLRATGRRRRLGGNSRGGSRQPRVGDRRACAGARRAGGAPAGFRKEPGLVADGRDMGTVIFRTPF